MGFRVCGIFEMDWRSWWRTQTDIWPIPSAPPAGRSLGATLRTHFPKLSKPVLLSHMTRITRMSTMYGGWWKLPCPEWHFSLSNTIWGMFGERNPMGKSDSLRRQKRLCLAQWYSYCRISHFQLNSQVLLQARLTISVWLSLFQLKQEGLQIQGFHLQSQNFACERD